LTDDRPDAEGRAFVGSFSIPLLQPLGANFSYGLLCSPLG